MSTYHLTFFSKNKKSLDETFLFFNNIKILKKFFFKKRKKQFFTILKSPHINKTAQEQFEILTYSRQLTLHTTKSLKFIFFLKKINFNLFSSVKIKIKLTLNNKKENELNNKLFNPTNYKLNNILTDNVSNYMKKNRKINIDVILSKNTKKIKSFLKLLDIYGELNTNL